MALFRPPQRRPTTFSQGPEGETIASPGSPQQQSPLFQQSGGGGQWSSGTRGTLATTGMYTAVPPTNAPASNVPGLTAGNYAYTRETQPTGLVEDRLNNLTESGSRYMQQAEATGLRQAGRRGLLNSSIAAGAARGEAIRQGLPIASQDAAAVEASRAASMDAENQGLMQSRDIQNRALLQASGAQDAASAFAAGQREAAADRAHQLRLQREGYAYEGEQRGLDRAHQLNSMGFDYGLRNQFQDNETFRNDWMNNNNFQRQTYAGLLQAGVGAYLGSMGDWQNQLNQALIDDPETFYDPEIAQGYADFMGGNVNNYISNFFTQFLGGGG